VIIVNPVAVVNFASHASRARRHRGVARSGPLVGLRPPLARATRFALAPTPSAFLFFYFLFFIFYFFIFLFFIFLFFYFFIFYFLFFYFFIFLFFIFLFFYFFIFYFFMNRGGAAKPLPSVPGGRGQRGLWGLPRRRPKAD
jgi:hypothetical protein